MEERGNLRVLISEQLSLFSSSLAFLVQLGSISRGCSSTTSTTRTSRATPCHDPVPLEWPAAAFERSPPASTAPSEQLSDKRTVSLASSDLSSSPLRSSSSRFAPLLSSKFVAFRFPSLFRQLIAPPRRQYTRRSSSSRRRDGLAALLGQYGAFTSS